MICAPDKSRELFIRAGRIRAIVFDVDGVLTDGSITYDSRKVEVKRFNAHDGQGIKLAREAGMTTGIISARESEAIRHRAAELGIEHVYLGRFDKLAAYGELKAAAGLADEAVCFIGDDLPDVPVFESVGLPVAVRNASAAVQAAAGFLTRRSGGEGAVREVVEFVLHAQDRLDSVLKMHRNEG